MNDTQYGFHEWKRTCPACKAFELNPEGCCPRCGYDGADDYEQRKRQCLAQHAEPDTAGGTPMIRVACPIRTKWRADYRASRLIRHYERDMLRPAGLSEFRFMPGGISPAASRATLGNRRDSLSFPRGHICRDVGGPRGLLP